jgi:membrane protease YdiL (CAAX protease family)
MQRIRFNGKDRLLMVICLLIFSLSIWFGVNNFEKAFPEATIDFQYNRTDSKPLAEDGLKILNLSIPEDYKHAAIFSYGGLAKTCLEKELGLDSMQYYMDNPVRLWGWSHRWFKPGEKEEYQARISTKGEVLYLNHLIEEEAEGADISRDSALVLADSFLFTTMKIDKELVELIEASKDGQPNRTDWNITYKHKTFEPIEDIEYRYIVRIQGDQISSYNEYVHVPEKWTADYKQLRSLNNLAGGSATLLMFLTIIAIVIVFFMKIRLHDIQWRTALIFGIIATTLQYLNTLNNWPNSLYFYDTTTSWGSFLINQFFIGLLLALGTGVLIAFLTASAESIFRELHKTKMSVPAIFTIRGWRTKSAFINIVVGITMTGFFFAYQAAFYMIADHFGGWSPADVPYSNLLNTALPWAAVLMIGFMPAVSEEFMSRMFSIPFLQKMFKNRFTWLAVLIPAIIWGFAHAGYPNQPFWVRGAEVGIAGIIIGVIMLKFGILAPLVWHYTVDALYTSFLLFQSDNLYFIITAAVGAGLLIIPLLLALIAYFRTGTFLSAKGSLNEDIVIKKLDLELTSETEKIAEEKLTEDKIETLEERAKTSIFQPKYAWLGLILIPLLMAAIWLKPEEKLGDYLEYPIPYKTAITAFSDSLMATGWADPDTLIIRAYAPDVNNPTYSTPAYMLANGYSIGETNRHIEPYCGYGSWLIRAWSPENRLRFYGTYNPRSERIMSMGLRTPEEMAITSVSMDSAEVLAYKTLTDLGVDLSNFELDDHKEFDYPDRKDHSLTFKAKDGDPRNMGEAKYHHYFSLTGDRIETSPMGFNKIPEEWKRERKATTPARTANRIVSVLLKAVIAGFAITMLILGTMKNRVNWKRAFIWAIIPFLFTLFGMPDNLHQFEEGYFYQVELSWEIYSMIGLVSMILLIIVNYLSYVLAIAVLTMLFPEKANLINPSLRRNNFLIGLAGVIPVFVALLLYATIKGHLETLFPGAIIFNGLGVIEWLGSPFAFGHLVHSAISSIALISVVVAVLYYIWLQCGKNIVLKAILSLGIVLILMPVDVIKPAQWLLYFVESGIVFLLVYLVLKFYIRGNIFAFFGAVWAMAVIPNSITGILNSGNSSSTTHTALYLAFMIILLLVLASGFRFKKT